MELSYIKLFTDFPDKTEQLSAEEIGRLVLAMILYARGDESYADQLIGNERFVFPVFKVQIDRDRADYDEFVDKQRENGAKGGRRKKPTGSFVNPENPTLFSKPTALFENPENPTLFSETQTSQEEEKEKEEEKEEDIGSTSVDPNAHTREPDPAQTQDRTVQLFGDGETARVIKAYRQQIGEVPNGRAYELLCSYIDDLGADAVIVAIEQTNQCQPSSPFPFLRKILDSFAAAGVHDRQTAEANVNDHKRRTTAARAAPAKPNPALEYEQHIYTEADYGADFYFDPMTKSYGGHKE